MGTSFGPEFRLRVKAQFDHVFKHRRRLSNHLFILYNTANAVGTARLGVMIGKRKVKHAVDRNRIKRCIREVFRVHRETLPAVDCVIVVKDFKGSVGDQAWLSAIEQLFGQLRRVSVKVSLG